MTKRIFVTLRYSLFVFVLTALIHYFVGYEYWLRYAIMVFVFITWSHFEGYRAGYESRKEEENK